MSRRVVEERNPWSALCIVSNRSRSCFSAATPSQYHDNKHNNVTEKEEAWHQSEGGFLKPIIFGGLDGILTSFAIVAGSAGGGLSPEVVLVLGFSNIFADALR